jgi:hypothetical protein
MLWELSHYRAGDPVEVRSKEEILATLDEHGCVDGLPFMPEMMQFCGRRFRVRAVAHKTCETALRTYRSRRIGATVHLDDLRCDGSAHGGCQAACTLFWKDVWLKPVAAEHKTASNGKPCKYSCGCSEQQLVANTQLPVVSSDDQPCYSCQATKLFDATTPLPWWNLRQYVLDVTTGNHSTGRVLRVGSLALLRFPWRVIKRIPVLRRLYAPVNELICLMLSGREAPYLFKRSKPLTKTPTGQLGLKPGELVRIKSKSEIEATLDAKGLNRGLSFDPEEMAPYCGGTFRVRASVTKIVDEETGRMRQMKQPCIILEGVVCRSEYARWRLNCTRAIPCYWRELWLERVSVEEPSCASIIRQQSAEPVEV